MNKYDFSLDLASNNSLSLLVKHLTPNSTVLELGPAMGRLTKYLSTELNCNVYIVEIDKEAYSSAIKFAKDGFLGDIEDYEWVEKFKNIHFDFIIFADVLEHLKWPKVAMEYAATILNKNGRILSSVPNIAHSGIIIGLLDNQFEYKQTGILDDTHLRFFTHKSLHKYFNDCGLVVTSEDAVYTPVSGVLDMNSITDRKYNLENEIEKKEYGNVFQFVTCCIKKECFYDNQISINNLEDPKKEHEAKFYWDTGEGFDERNAAVTKIKDGEFQYKIEIKSEIVALRFLPITMSAVDLVLSEVVVSNGVVSKNIVPSNSNGYCFGWNWIFNNIEPQLIFSFDKEYIEQVVISGFIDILALEEADSRLNSKLLEQRQEFHSMAKIYQEQLATNEFLLWRSENIEKQYEDLNRIYQNLEKRHEDLACIYQKLELQHKELAGFYQNLSHQHDDLIVLYQGVDGRHRDLEDKHEKLKLRFRKIIESRFWNITKLIRKIFNLEIDEDV